MDIKKLIEYYRKNPKKWQDHLKGGIADKKSPKDFDPKALAEGTKVESEHVADKNLGIEISQDHLSEDPNYYSKLKKIEGFVDNAPGSSAHDYLDRNRNLHPEVKQMLDNSKQKKPLIKSAGQIKPKYLEPKFTRPDQEVKQIDIGDVNDSYADTSTSEKIARHKYKKAYGEVRDFPIQSSNEGFSIPRKEYDHPQAFAVAGVHDLAAHEGHHVLADKLVNKYGVDKIHNMYDKLISNIHPKILPLVNTILDSNEDYKKMAYNASPRYRLARKEEIINVLRDFVHGSGKDSRRNAWNKAINSENFRNAWGLKDRNEADLLMKQSWKKVRDHANLMKPEDL